MTEPWTSDPGGPGTPIVLLHPGGTDSRSMSALAEAFGGARVVLVDRAGHGRTPDVDGPWHFADMAEELAGTVRSLGAGPVHLVGCRPGSWRTPTPRCPPILRSTGRSSPSSRGCCTRRNPR
ncbi:alpha/beta hydrolase [Curtobacterium sp. GD1]|uniref:alpha/beta fold hydrolase n=1 Tax=Curtobacterium sp. GD1 TaxID=2810612 RepID=UPI0027E11111|nr:alpha/beta hydrolase [Curtobacterium sp. GD1]